MAQNMRLLRGRIKTAKNITQITKAMEMVAASKMRRAQEQTVSGKPYTEKLTAIAQNLIGRVEEGTHPYFTEQVKGKTLLLLFSSDKGLCGSFNTNIYRELVKTGNLDDVEVIAVGKKLVRPVIRLGGVLLADFPFGTTLPPFETVFPISALIVESFLKEEYKEVKCIFTQFVSLRVQKPVTITLLPIKKAEETAKQDVLPYTFEPNAQELLSALMPHYLEMSLYQMLLESYASEQASRMIAMHQASENAKDVIWALTLVFNKARQERITNELLDIATGVVGANA